MASLFLKGTRPVGYSGTRNYFPPRLSNLLKVYVGRNGGMKPPWSMHPRLIEHQIKARPIFTREQFGLIRQKAARRAVQNAARRHQR